MRKSAPGLTILLSAGLSLSTPACTSPATAERRDLDESAQNESAQIRAILERQVEAWNAGDLEGFMAGYWNSPSVSFFSGGIELRGWDANLDRYRRTYQEDRSGMGHLEFRELQVELLGGESAYVTGRFLLIKPGVSEATGRFTLILRHLENEWRIVHDHTCR